ncbi:MAG: response regulator [Elusimicrobia bacterium]|nr:response regulator [Elusimicrobiota bacterium]
MPRVIVVDDDEIVGNLTLDLVTGMGFDAELIQDSTTVMAAVKAKKPELVILDILMPGIDGLTLCHHIKSDPATQNIKVAMVSGKVFAEERDRAKQYGADLLIKKPYDVMTFGEQIKALLSGPAPVEEPEAPPLKDFNAVKDPKYALTVWGCRSLSSHTTRMRSRYGFQTSCVSVEVGGHYLILDAGSGIIDLGQDLLSGDAKRKEVWLFLTHFHQDHIQGLAFLPCLRRPDYTVNIGGANDPDKSLETLIKESFEKYPSTMRDPFVAEVQLYELQEDSYEMLPGINLTAFYANHPSTTLGFMFETGGRKMIYCPDSEIYGETATALQDYDEKLGAMCAGADLIIHNARFLPDDYKRRKNNGHTSYVSAIEFAARNKIKRLLMFHHDDQYDDETLDGISEDAAKLIARKGYALECVMARAGMKFSV